MAPDIVVEQNTKQAEPSRSSPKFQRRTRLRNLKKESERQKTFTNWPVSFLDSKKLAKNGFYYTNSADKVRCVFCGVEVGLWDQGDVVETEHMRANSQCPFIRGQDCGNQVQTEDEEDAEDDEEDEVTSQDVCGSYGLEIRPFSAPERPGKTPLSIEFSNFWRDFEKLGVSKMSGPAFPYYATYNARIKTFENWPIPKIQSPEKLAEAGFYYTAFHDSVMCFHCGGGLRNWEVEDDPWVEHALWFSRCGFVILQKGREFINEILTEEKRQLAALTVEGLSNCSETSRKSSEKLNQPEKNERKEETVMTPKSQSQSQSPSSSFISSSDKESRRTPSPNTDGKEIELCRICYVRERGVVFLPCGHFVSCTQCAPSLSTCAVCRKPFEATVRAYLS